MEVFNPHFSRANHVKAEFSSFSCHSLAEWTERTKLSRGNLNLRINFSCASKFWSKTYHGICLLLLSQKTFQISLDIVFGIRNSNWGCPGATLSFPGVTFILVEIAYVNTFPDLTPGSCEPAPRLNEATIIIKIIRGNGTTLQAALKYSLLVKLYVKWWSCM